MSAIERNIQLARQLPPRLQQFLALNPPRRLTTVQSTSRPDTEAADFPNPSASTDKPNPFLPHKNDQTGRWHPPIYSLRRQAELVKLARAHGVEDLLPATSKNTSERQRRQEEHIARIQQVGNQTRVKGHIWERTLKGRLEKRRQAMMEMPRLIQEWKQVCRCPVVGSSQSANFLTARPRTRVEEVATVRVSLITYSGRVFVMQLDSEIHNMHPTTRLNEPGCPRKRAMCTIHPSSSSSNAIQTCSFLLLSSDARWVCLASDSG